MDLSLTTILLLFIASGFAGLVDSMAGGGGLIQLPALLVALPHTLTATVLGTSKLASFIGTSNSVAIYVRRRRPDWRLTGAMSIPAFFGAMAGATAASNFPKESARPFVLAMLILVALYTWRKKNLGLQENLRFARQRSLVIGMSSGLVIGFYDGIFGPGTGSFLMVVLVAVIGMEFIDATVTTKITNWAANLGGLIIFGINGHLLWLLALTMAIANVTGNHIGARLVLRGGSEFVRRAFLLVTLILIIKLAIDTVRH